MILCKLPADMIKIDRSFIQHISTSPRHNELVKSIIMLGENLEKAVVAEGVENDDQLDFLRQRGVKIVQGYLFSPPVPVETFHELLQQQ